MSFISDLRAVSESALNQVATRFSDLPRPLLAAIGAGDMAVERLAELRQSLLGDGGMPAPGDLADSAKDFAEDLPAKVQKVVAEVTEQVEKFAAEAPDRTKKLVSELPDKFAEVRTALSQEQLKETVEGYTQLAAMVYGSLADRGDKTWTKVVESAGVDTTVVDGKAEDVTAGSAGAADEKADEKPEDVVATAAAEAADTAADAARAAADAAARAAASAAEVTGEDTGTTA